MALISLVRNVHFIPGRVRAPDLLRERVTKRPSHNLPDLEDAPLVLGRATLR
jgi:hypothetical protein